MNIVHGIFFQEREENNNNVVYLLFLTPLKTTQYKQLLDQLSGKSRFRKKGDTIDSATCKKENKMSRTNAVWDATGGWLTVQSYSFLKN